MSSPLNRLKEGSPQYRAEMIKFLEQELARARKEMGDAIKNPSRVAELSNWAVSAQNIENELRRLRGR